VKDDLIEELADDIAAVMAQLALGDCSSPRSATLAFLHQDLRLMRQTQSPTVPTGARLNWLKAAILRAMRVFTRSQVAFNGAVTRVSVELMNRVRELEEELAQTRRQLAVLESRLIELQSPSEKATLVGSETTNEGARF